MRHGLGNILSNGTICGGKNPQGGNPFIYPFVYSGNKICSAGYALNADATFLRHNRNALIAPSARKPRPRPAHHRSPHPAGRLRLNKPGSRKRQFHHPPRYRHGNRRLRRRRTGNRRLHPNRPGSRSSPRRLRYRPGSRQLLLHFSPWRRPGSRLHRNNHRRRRCIHTFRSRRLLLQPRGRCRRRDLRARQPGCSRSAGRWDASCFSRESTTPCSILDPARRKRPAWKIRRMLPVKRSPTLFKSRLRWLVSGWLRVGKSRPLDSSL